MGAPAVGRVRRRVMVVKDIVAPRCRGAGWRVQASGDGHGREGGRADCCEVAAEGSRRAQSSFRAQFRAKNQIFKENYRLAQARSEEKSQREARPKSILDVALFHEFTTSAREKLQTQAYGLVWARMFSWRRLGNPPVTQRTGCRYLLAGRPLRLIRLLVSGEMLVKHGRWATFADRPVSVSIDLFVALLIGGVRRPAST